MDIQQPSFHLHMISDATGETLATLAKAVGVQYAQVRAIEHLHPLVRSRRELDRVLKEVEAAPGIVLYTLFNRDLADALEQSCKQLNVPCIAPLKHVLQVFESYLGMTSTPDRRRPASTGCGLFPPDRSPQLHDASRRTDICPIVSTMRISFSSASAERPRRRQAIYLANRGFKTANVPLVAGLTPPPELEQETSAFVVALVASPERIAQVRQNRVIEQSHAHLEDYVDRDVIAAEIAQTRQLCARHGWPIIDVTRRSIEETAAAIIRLYHDREAPELDA